MKRIPLLILVLLFQIYVKAQFEIVASTNQNECKWYVKNTGVDTLKLTSASMRFFHHSPAIVFTPSITIPGGGKYQYKGNFSGNGKYVFEYKTIQIPPLDSMIDPGEMVLISTTTNTGNTKDTIIISGVKIYYSKKGVPYSADAFPQGISPCASEGIFISAGSSNSGIKLGSASAGNLHSGNCTKQIVAIVFDYKTLLRKAISGPEPNCPWGKKWTAFGDASDYQVYYSFNIGTSLAQLQFDSFVNAVATNDYVALTFSQIDTLAFLNSVKSSLLKLGFQHANFSDTIGYFSMLGKKDASSGEAAYNYCQDPHGTCNISMEHSMIANDSSDAILDYALCFENYAQVLDMQPVTNKQNPAPNGILVYPNPGSDGWFISGLRDEMKVELLTMSGNLIKLHLQTDENFLSAADLPSGAYVLCISDCNHKVVNRIILFRL